MVDIFLLSLPIIIPLFSAFFLILIGKQLKQFATIIPISSLGLTVGILFYYLLDTKSVFKSSGAISFFLPNIDNFEFLIGLRYDSLGLFMSIIASTLSFLIAIFSIEYMKDDQWINRYWFFFLIFVASMNLLVLAGDLLFLYIGWEGVGLCSFALIAHWFKKKGEDGEKPAKAGLKAFIFTQIGDIGLLIAIAIIFSYNNTLSLSRLTTSLYLPSGMYPIVLSLIFFAVIGKSAQFPLLTWLSSPDSVDIDAMQGPTTVSALIHAATMVKAGIYLMARFYPIFNKFNVTIFAQLMSVIIAITIIISALSALTAKDLKRVLAYSTISQLSYMLLALSIAYFGEPEHHISDTAFLASLSHVLNHAVFKALLFLSAAAIIHSCHTRSILNMGGLRTKMPVVFYSMVIGALALIGVPLFSGFFSKEAIVGISFEFALTSKNYAIWGWFLFVISLIVVIITSAYTTRLIILIFTGQVKMEDAISDKKSNIIINIVLLLLAFLTLVIGYLIESFDEWFSDFIDGGSLHLIPSGDGIISFILTMICIILGISLTYFIYKDGNRSWNIEKYPHYIKDIQTVIAEGFYIDQTITYYGNELLKFLSLFKRLHTGNLNKNMFGVGLLFILIFTAVMIF